MANEEDYVQGALLRRWVESTRPMRPLSEMPEADGIRNLDRVFFSISQSHL